MKTDTKKTIAGVEFIFRRVNNPRNGGRHWSVIVAKSGKALECFPGKTLEEKVFQIENTARIIGTERFIRDTLAA